MQASGPLISETSRTLSRINIPVTLSKREPALRRSLDNYSIMQSTYGRNFPIFQNSFKELLVDESFVKEKPLYHHRLVEAIGERNLDQSAAEILKDYYNSDDVNLERITNSVP